jgi:IS5 family transposase
MYGAEVWQIPTREINTILSTEMFVLRRSAQKSRMERIKNEHIKEIMVVKGKADIIEKKKLQWHDHVKRLSEERISKLIMEWIPQERRKRGRPKKRGWKEDKQP